MLDAGVPFALLYKIGRRGVKPYKAVYQVRQFVRKTLLFATVNLKKRQGKTFDKRVVFRNTHFH